ncbi:hypothetical protein [Streptomyces sp. NPDC015125]|uniref:hypothetical protein n=1 Tax=Streptomyces sp. NPDC015125 TaxID=3364938 RepID=UPI0037009DE0
MARNIGMGPNSPLYRAVITATYTEEDPLIDDMNRYHANNETLSREGLTLTWYEGPYSAPGRVSSRITTWRKIYAKKPYARVECYPEMCQPQWQRTPGPSDGRSGAA